MSVGEVIYGGIYIVVLYAAIWDYKHRIIPDKVSVALVLFGVVGAIFIPAGGYGFIRLGDRLIAGLIPAVTLIMIYQLDKRIGGGDLKLLTALGFNLGLNALAVVLIATTVTAAIWSWHKHQNSVPLAVFLAIGITFYYIILKMV